MKHIARVCYQPWKSSAGAFWSGVVSPKRSRVGFVSRVIVIEFDSPEQVMAWYNCPEYQAIVSIRHANATTRAARLIGA